MKGKSTEKRKKKTYFVDEPLQITKVFIDRPEPIKNDILVQSKILMWRLYYKAQYKLSKSEDDQIEREFQSSRMKKLRLVIKDLTTIQKKSYLIC